MDLQLSGKLALVTGSTPGIGLAIGSALAGEGAMVIINGRSSKRVTEAIEKIREQHPHSKLEALIGDLSTGEAVQRTTKQFPDVDILINNLGVYEVKPFEGISDEDWMAVIETNFMSAVRLSRHYLPKMKAKDWGRIIFISSESAINIPVEMNPLRGDENHATRVGAGPGGNDSRHECDSQFRLARTDAIRGSRAVHQTHGQVPQLCGGRGARVLRKGPSQFTA